jgi:hypothetical protein
MNDCGLGCASMKFACIKPSLDWGRLHGLGHQRQLGQPPGFAVPQRLCSAYVQRLCSAYVLSGTHWCPP